LDDIATPSIVTPGPACAKPKRLRFGEGRPAEGRDPAIHAQPARIFQASMDARIKSGHDDSGSQALCR
jgi:hypothetical protein